MSHLVEGLLGKSDSEGLQSVISSMVSAEVSLALARGVLYQVAKGLEVLDSESCRQVGEFFLSTVGPRVTSFEESDGIARDNLADVYKDVDQDFEKAAKVLSGKGSSTLKTEEEKFFHYVTIAQLYLQEDKSIEAESFINRAQPVKHECKDLIWQLRFQTAYAQILDSNRKFLEASMRYYEICQVHENASESQIDDSEISRALEKSLVCAVLGPAGPQRSRILSSLYKDERVKRLTHFNVLEKMYMGRLLKKSEIAAFESTLMPHQLATLTDGSSVLERAVMEHNMLAASKVSNILSRCN